MKDFEQNKTLDLQQLELSNEQWYTDVRLLPKLNYISENKGINNWKFPSMTNGQNFYDNNDGRQRRYYAEWWVPEREWLQKVQEVTPFNVYFEGDYVWEEFPAWTYKLYRATQNNTVSNTVPRINPAFWEEVNVVEWLFPNQIEYGHLRTTPVGIVLIPTNTPTQLNFWDGDSIRSVKYNWWPDDNPWLYTIQTDGVYIITCRVEWDAQVSGTFRKIQLLINWGIVSTDIIQAWSSLEQYNELNYHIRTVQWTTISVQVEHDAGVDIEILDDHTYLHVTRIS